MWITTAAKATSYSLSPQIGVLIPASILAPFPHPGHIRPVLPSHFVSRSLITSIMISQRLLNFNFQMKIPNMKHFKLDVCSFSPNPALVNFVKVNSTYADTQSVLTKCLRILKSFVRVELVFCHILVTLIWIWYISYTYKPSPNNLVNCRTIV